VPCVLNFPMDSSCWDLPSPSRSLYFKIRIRTTTGHSPQVRLIASCHSYQGASSSQLAMFQATAEPPQSIARAIFCLGRSIQVRGKYSTSSRCIFQFSLFSLHGLNSVRILQNVPLCAPPRDILAHLTNTPLLLLYTALLPPPKDILFPPHAPNQQTHHPRLDHNIRLLLHIHLLALLEFKL
jgi:hypothetical protein